MFNFLKEFLNLGYYVSDLDQFLANFDKTHPKLSTSQLAEKQKYDLIFQLRDGKNTTSTHTPALWDKF